MKREKIQKRSIYDLRKRNENKNSKYILFSNEDTEIYIRTVNFSLFYLIIIPLFLFSLYMYSLFNNISPNDNSIDDLFINIAKYIGIIGFGLGIVFLLILGLFVLPTPLFDKWKDRIIITQVHLLNSDPIKLNKISISWEDTSTNEKGAHSYESKSNESYLNNEKYEKVFFGNLILTYKRKISMKVLDKSFVLSFRNIVPISFYRLLKFSSIYVDLINSSKSYP